MKKFVIKFEVFWDATDIREVVVNANTERKAIKIAAEKVKKQTGWDIPKFISIKEVNDVRTAEKF